MKKTITLRNNTILNHFEEDLFKAIEKENIKQVSSSIIKSLVHFSKSLTIASSSSVKGLNFEIVTN